MSYYHDLTSTTELLVNRAYRNSRITRIHDLISISTGDSQGAGAFLNEMIEKTAVTALAVEMGTKQGLAAISGLDASAASIAKEMGDKSVSSGGGGDGDGSDEGGGGGGGGDDEIYKGQD